MAPPGLERRPCIRPPGRGFVCAVDFLGKGGRPIWLRTDHAARERLAADRFLCFRIRLQRVREEAVLAFLALCGPHGGTGLVPLWTR